MSTRVRPTPRGGRRVCLFCDNNANSLEHSWPDWMGKHFPRGDHDKSVVHWEPIETHRSRLPAAVIFHGHPVTTKIKAVCKRCNNGWMSVLEQDAISFTESMLFGRRILMDAVAQKTLARCVTLKMMVWEQRQPQAGVYRRCETLAFAATKFIPNTTKIRLFRWSGLPMWANITRAYSGIFEKNIILDVALIFTLLRTHKHIGSRRQAGHTCPAHARG